MGVPKAEEREEGAEGLPKGRQEAALEEGWM